MIKNSDEALARLKRSKFRSSFHLRKYMLEYINKNGIDKIEEHSYDFLKKRLAPAYIKNDGHQTPMKGHPTFIAQHATATCCRGCLEKWYGIPKDRELNACEIDFFVSLIMKWIKEEIAKSGGII